MKNLSEGLALSLGDGRAIISSCFLRNYAELGIRETEPRGEAGCEM